MLWAYFSILFDKCKKKINFSILFSKVKITERKRAKLWMQNIFFINHIMFLKQGGPYKLSSCLRWRQCIKKTKCIAFFQIDYRDQGGRPVAKLESRRKPAYKAGSFLLVVTRITNNCHDMVILEACTVKPNKVELYLLPRTWLTCWRTITNKKSAMLLNHVNNLTPTGERTLLKGFPSAFD